MKLQILVPHYKERAEEISPLLDSIAIQQQIDFNDIGVIICHDGIDIPPLNFPEYPFWVKQIWQEHKGVSAARNACLDAATADYVMFCDADDMFMHMCGLYIIFREMNGDGFNAMVSIFVEETKDARTGEKVYINRQMDTTFVHGKVYRRSYLNNNQIRWNDSLTIHEDSYFNCLAQRLTKEVKYCQQPFYLWKWRDTSVCRHDPKYILKTYNNMLDSNTALVKEFQARKRDMDAQYYATSMIYDAYFMMNKDEWLNQENQEYRSATEKRFKEYFETFEGLFNTIPEDTKKQIIMGMKNRFFGEGMFMETVTFNDWIEHIKSL
jgi:glycosyltransferase involved in cell wall biosynthesis